MRGRKRQRQREKEVLMCLWRRVERDRRRQGEKVRSREAK